MIWYSKMLCIWIEFKKAHAGLNIIFNNCRLTSCGPLKKIIIILKLNFLWKRFHCLTTISLTIPHLEQDQSFIKIIVCQKVHFTHKLSGNESGATISNFFSTMAELALHMFEDTTCCFLWVWSTQRILDFKGVLMCIPFCTWSQRRLQDHRVIKEDVFPWVNIICFKLVLVKE